MNKIIAALALALTCCATPARAQADVTVPVPTVTAMTAGTECMAQAVRDYRSAWQQDAGRPYLSADTGISVQWAVQAAARGCEFRRATAPAGPADPAALNAARKQGADAVKAAVMAAMAGL